MKAVGVLWAPTAKALQTAADELAADVDELIGALRRQLGDEGVGLEKIVLFCVMWVRRRAEGRDGLPAQRAAARPCLAGGCGRGGLSVLKTPRSATPSLRRRVPSVRVVQDPCVPASVLNAELARERGRWL